MKYVLVSVVLANLAFIAAPACAADWVRGGREGTEPLWGIAGNLQFAIPPASRGPRGLIRLLYPTLPGGKCDLINFIAVEPIVKGERGLSELEHSKLDDKPGKRFWVEPQEIEGTLSGKTGEVQTLRVVVLVEPFDNGAHVRLTIEQRSDLPDEIALTVQAEPDSAPMEYCILTATMGNKARCRLLWLKDKVVSSKKLYPDYQGPDFAEHKFFPASLMTVTQQGDLIAAITNDEADPTKDWPYFGRSWYYGGFPVTQYWKKLKGTWRDDVQAVVNARYMYWQSNRPIPGGIAFENFELIERFYPNQQFVFGITSQTPEQLGLKSRQHATSSRAAD